MGKRLDTIPGAGSFFYGIGTVHAAKRRSRAIDHLSLTVLRVDAGGVGSGWSAPGLKTGAFGPKLSLEPMASILASSCPNHAILVTLKINYKSGN